MVEQNVGAERGRSEGRVKSVLGAEVAMYALRAPIETFLLARGIHVPWRGLAGQVLAILQ